MFLVHAKIFFFFTTTLALALALNYKHNQKQFFSPCQSTAIALNQLKTAELAVKKKDD